MKITRRTLIKSSAAAATMIATSPGSAREPAPSLIVFDSRNTKSAAFARGVAAPSIDVAHQDTSLWRALRTSDVAGPVSGMTSWSDWVVVRGLLEEQGLRVQQEASEGSLFTWSMA